MAETIFKIKGTLIDFGGSPKVGIKVRATAIPEFRNSSASVLSNEPENTVTNSSGYFEFNLISLSGLWYRIQTPYDSSMDPIRIPDYVPNLVDPTTGTIFSSGVVLDIKDLIDKEPTPSY